MWKSCLLIILILIGACSPKISSDIPTKKTTHPNKDTRTKLLAGRCPRSIEVSDFNKDGLNDLIVSYHCTNNVIIYLAKGPRKFEPGHVFEMGQVLYHPNKALPVDFNRDEKTDFLLASETEDGIQFWQKLNLRDFKKIGTVSASSPLWMEISDLDGNGYLDIVIGPYTGKSVRILWGKGGLDFESTTINSNPTPSYIHLADFNNDGLIDILWPEWDTGSVVLALNKGNRKFEKMVLRPPPEKLDSPRSLATADIDGDGNLDVVVACETGPSALLLYGDGNKGIIKRGEIKSPEWGFNNVATRQTDEGATIALSLNNKIIIYKATKNGIKKLKTYSVNGLPLALQFYDVDKDGRDDLLYVMDAGTEAGVIWDVPFE